MFNKLKSQNGQFVTFFLVYPILILLVAYGILAFLQSVTSHTQIRKQYAGMQAEYRAVRGMSYIFYETITHSVGEPFAFFTVGADNILEPIDFGMAMPPEPNIWTAHIDLANLTYVLPGQFEAKIYTQLNAEGETIYFALVKGTAGGESRLYFYRLEGSPMYEFMYFFPGDVDFGWQNIDALGGRIHANGNVRFNEDVHIDNVSEFSTAGKFSVDHAPFVHPDDEVSNVFFPRRWPYATPNDFDPNNPPVPGTGNYVNSLDGHYAGERTGLIVFNAGANQAEIWDPTNPAKQIPGPNGHYHATLNPLGELKPIFPYGTQVPSDSQNWAADQSKNYLYAENDINCWKTDPVSCATDSNYNHIYTKNANLYEKSTQINGVKIPSRMPASAAYTEKQYYGNPAGGNPQTYNVYATDTQKNQLAKDWWADFIADFPTVENNPQSFSGIADTLKDANGGGERITPPKIDVTALAKSSSTSNRSLIIRKVEDVDGDGNPIVVTRVRINATDTIVVDPVSGYTNSCAPGQTIFEIRNFVNNKFATPEEMVVVNIGALMTCEAVDFGTQWLPLSGVISNVYITGDDYDSYPVSLAITNAKTLPQNGLTYIVNGNLLFQGHYNYDPANTLLFEPSAAIVSNRVSLVSDDFDYPTTLPMTQHHVNYPAAWDYINADGIPDVGEGTGFDKDYITTQNYNWLAKYDPDNPANPLITANKVRGGVINGDIREYHYNVSLVGKYAVTPDFLEVWNYYEDPGTQTTAPDPATWRENNAIVSGSFIQLEEGDFLPLDTIPSTAALDPVPTVPFNRTCDPANNGGRVARIENDGTIVAFNGGGLPCRDGSNPGNPWDLVAANKREDQRYEPRYLQPGNTPPGNLSGFADAFFIKILFNDYNWTHHSPNLL